MANGSSLNRHNDQQLLDCVFGRVDDAKLKFLRAGDHLSQQLVHSIGMHAGTLHNTRAELRAHPGNGRAHALLAQVIVGRPNPCKVLSFFA